jgi:hypothetical protein
MPDNVVLTDIIKWPAEMSGGYVHDDTDTGQRYDIDIRYKEKNSAETVVTLSVVKTDAFGEFRLGFDHGGGMILREGVIDEAAIRAFTHVSYSPELAEKLHDKTGWPQVRGMIEPDGPGYTGFGIHGVVMPDGKILDIEGPHDRDEWMSRHNMIGIDVEPQGGRDDYDHVLCRSNSFAEAVLAEVFSDDGRFFTVSDLVTCVGWDDPFVVAGFENSERGITVKVEDELGDIHHFRPERLEPWTGPDVVASAAI